MATTASDATSKEAAKVYTFFNPKLRNDTDSTGDVYDKYQVALSQARWGINDTDRLYLKHIKSLSNTWPHLRLLADFMEISTTPLRWPQLKYPWKETERDERASRTNVTRLDYLNSGAVVSSRYETSEALRTALTGESQEKDADNRHLRLFVVEDLSRDVIELLGANLDIEPAFFREQIADYAWYNPRDRWVDPPNLKMVARRNQWASIRFVTARYYETKESFKEGFTQAQSFNVLRRPDDDQNNMSIWDDGRAIIGITRSRASIWYGSDVNQQTSESQEKRAVAVLLLDPTIQAGVPLWYGYRNWETAPKMADLTPVGPPRDSLYNDLIYWAQKPDAVRTELSNNHASNTPTLNYHVPVQALLHIICAEWLTMADYIKTRLGQIEWEVNFPDSFLGNRGDKSYMLKNFALKKLHVWRRLVPLYREELTETLQRVSHFPCHTLNLIHRGNGFGSTKSNGASDSTSASTDDHCPISAFHDEFAGILSYMEEYQQRVDRITSLGIAVIAMEDAETARKNNRNVARLTWLATCFIPLSFVATLFSMQGDITQLHETYKWYFAAALPLSAMVIGLALVMALRRN